MPDEGRKRANLDLNDDIGLEEFIESTPAQKKPDPEKALIHKVAEQSGFVSRQPKKRIRRRKVSPYTEQLGVKVRPQIRDIFHDIGDRLGVYDHTTFERAILALIEKEGMHDLKDEYRNTIK